MTTQTTDVASVNNAPRANTVLKVVLGTMTFGKKGAEATRVHDVNDCVALLDVLQAHGHNEIDTARVYGTSEELLGNLDLKERGIVLGTKLKAGRFGPSAYSYMKEDLGRGMTDSLKALQTDSIDLWYLHTPDHSVPYAETLEAVDNLYKQGHFKRFGISNYAAWEVAQICELCDRNGWKRPDVYQGCYNALQRTVEPELFPCLRNYGIVFYAFSPLAGGMLTDKYNRDTMEYEPGSRYDPNGRLGKHFRGWYWNDAYFTALDTIRPVAHKLGLTTDEAALRWLRHHSAMKSDSGDAVVMGASGVAQLQSNLTRLEKGPLPQELVEAFEEAWTIAKPVCKPDSV